MKPEQKEYIILELKKLINIIDHIGPNVLVPSTSDKTKITATQKLEFNLKLLQETGMTRNEILTAIGKEELI